MYEYTRKTQRELVPVVDTIEGFKAAALSNMYHDTDGVTRYAAITVYSPRAVQGLKILKNRKASVAGKILPFAATPEEAEALRADGAGAFYSAVGVPFKATGEDADLLYRWNEWMETVDLNGDPK